MSEKIVCVDVGLKRIGVAFGFKGIAVPLSPILRKNRNQAASDLAKILNEYDAKILVVGVPKGGASEDEMRRRIEHFISLVNFSGDIVYQNEAFSSFEASDLANDGRDGKFDSISAMIILKRYLKIT
ncbi:Holliday junction resolvase RuvX [Campylobacter gastrosuis]|uniref:Putative pre-16S rRNA nuclease n=1 Tax=Campylobacter gastrosuis TaxID=2974576 RepID=A0ABT7HQ54_9BACT|nr:Holliday junction resolvase RuvX [Campylobacter gastrosuis]MDL0089024.1 Holliday junction resolvase RuvX [Campylobacter gastrosuis]